MIVVMAAGLAANLSFNPLDAVTTVLTDCDDFGWRSRV